MSRRITYWRKRVRQSPTNEPGFPSRLAVSTGRTQRVKVHPESGEVTRYPGRATLLIGTKPMKDENVSRVMAVLKQK